MFDQEAARSLAQKAVSHGQVVDRTRSTETREGWFFPYEPEIRLIGSNRVIVHKHTGRTFVLGSAFPVERDLRAFDEGFQFEVYDLVVLEVRDRHKTVDVLASVGPTVVVPEYQEGTVWRIPRRLSKYEIDGRLGRLPVVFPEVRLYFCVEALQEVRERRHFRFEALEFRGHRTA
jgi:hypothetical protein